MGGGYVLLGKKKTISIWVITHPGFWFFFQVGGDVAWDKSKITKRGGWELNIFCFFFGKGGFGNPKRSFQGGFPD